MEWRGPAHAGLWDEGPRHRLAIRQCPCSCPFTSQSGSSACDPDLSLTNTSASISTNAHNATPGPRRQSPFLLLLFSFRDSNLQRIARVRRRRLG